MKAQSTIEKKEREYRRDILAIHKQQEEGCYEDARLKSLVCHWRALRWVLGKDDDEMCLTPARESGDGG